MKFKIMKEGFDPFEPLNEKILDEDRWVEIEPYWSGGKEQPYFLYLPKDKQSGKQVQDEIDDFLGYIVNGNSGYHKQQLDQNIIRHLRNIYRNNPTLNFNILNYSVNPANVIPNRQITLADRKLRRQAPQVIHPTQYFEPKTQSIQTFSNKVMIHHKQGGEKNNRYDNIVLIDRCYGDQVARAVHNLIEHHPSLTMNTIEIPLYTYNTKTHQWEHSNSAFIEIV